jgi:hypothetical protein
MKMTEELRLILGHVYSRGAKILLALKYEGNNGMKNGKWIKCYWYRHSSIDNSIENDCFGSCCQNKTKLI